VHGFQAWFRYEVETRLKRLPDLGYEEEKDKIKIAIMTLAFNNQDMIELLKDRGNAIMKQNWEKKRQIERKIIDLKNVKTNYKRLITPVHVFLTF